MTELDQKHPSCLVIIMDIVNTITNLAIGGVAMGGIGIAILSNDSELITHMCLVITGYVLIISQGVMSMNLTSGWAKAFRYEHKRNIHLVVQVVGAILGISGSAYAMSLRNKYNLIRTNHGRMGLVTMAFTIITLIGGLVHAFTRNLIPANISRICHALFGCLTIIFIFVTYILGLERIYSGTNLFPVYVTLAVISIVGIITPPLTNNLRRIMK